jgi:hypothetical protein
VSFFLLSSSPPAPVIKGLQDMDSFLIYLDGLVTFVPSEQELPTALKLYTSLTRRRGIN